MVNGRLTQVVGLSGSGKSMLCDIITDLISDIKHNNGQYPDYYERFVVFDAKVNNIKISDLNCLRDKLIFIDRADDLNQSLLEYIKYDRSNIYIIFARNCLGLGISPN